MGYPKKTSIENEYEQKDLYTPRFPFEQKKLRLGISLTLRDPKPTHSSTSTPFSPWRRSRSNCSHSNWAKMHWQPLYPKQENTKNVGCLTREFIYLTKAAPKISLNKVLGIIFIHFTAQCWVIGHVFPCFLLPLSPTWPDDLQLSTALWPVGEQTVLWLRGCGRIRWFSYFRKHKESLITPAPSNYRWHFTHVGTFWRL